jgi:hypothetical protein
LLYFIKYSSRIFGIIGIRVSRRNLFCLLGHLVRVNCRLNLMERLTFGLLRCFWIRQME